MKCGLFLSPLWETSDTLSLFTDASGSLGYEGIFQKRFFQGKWLPCQQLGQRGISILWQELYAINVVCYLWGTHWTSKRIHFYCDNQGVVKVINSRRSKVPRVMDLVRDLTLCTLQHNFYFRAVHNNMADSLSFPDGMLPPDSTPSQCNTRPHPSLFVQAPAKEAERYLGMSLAPSTEKTYGSGMRQFFTFCSQMYVNPQLPIREDILINFSVAMARSVQYTTIRTICRQLKITIPATAMSFTYLISFVSGLFFEALSIHRGTSPKNADQ